MNNSGHYEIIKAWAIYLYKAFYHDDPIMMQFIDVQWRMLWHEASNMAFLTKEVIK